jgi:hypothetical protein
MKKHNIGCANKISGLLDEYDLETDWDVVGVKSVSLWRMEVKKAAERKNVSRLKD